MAGKGKLLLPLAELKGRISRAKVLIGLYEKHASSEGNPEAIQREMRIVKDELLSELGRSKKILQGIQHDLRED